jgi:hypothetical protein
VTPCVASVLMLILVILGMRLVVTGWRARCDLEYPHCRRCGYNLTGLTSPRCPECGSHLAPEMVVQGWRHADRRRIGRGVLLIAIAGAVFGVSQIPFVRHFSRLSLRPTAVLLNDLESEDRVAMMQAAGELLRRESRLDAGALRRIAAVARDRYVGGRARWDYDPLRIWLKPLHDLGLFTAEDFRQMVAGGLRFELRAREKHYHQDPFPFEVAATANQRARSDLGWLVGGALAVSDVRNDGRTAAHTLEDWCERDGRWTILGVVDAGELTGGTLHVLVDVDCYDLFEVPIQVTQELTLEYALAATPEETLRLTRSPELDARMQQVVKSASASACSGTCLTVRLETDGVPPIDCAFEVVAVVEGEEHVLGPLVLHANEESQEGGCLCTSLSETAPDSIDVILRSSRARACESFDLSEIWGGELAFPAVPVQHASD